MSAGTKITVGVRNNDVEFALRKFKNQVARNGNLSKARKEQMDLSLKDLKKEKKKRKILLILEKIKEITKEIELC